MKIEIITKQNKARLTITDHIERTEGAGEGWEIGFPGDAGMEIEISQMRKLSDNAWISIKHWVEDNYQDVLKNEKERREKAFSSIVKTALNTSKPKGFLRTKTSGFVYLLGASNGLFKIGKSKDVNARLSDLRKQSPVDIEILHYFMSEDHTAAEKSLHQKYADKRKIGEWFLLSDNEVSSIQRIGDFQL